MQLIGKRQTKISLLNTDKNNALKNIEDIKKDIARANFRTSIIVDANPDAADLRKEEAEVIVDCNKQIEEVNKSIEEINKEIAEQEKGITAIENGETKVNLEELNQLVDVLLLDITKSVAVEAAKGAASVPEIVA